MKRKLKKLLIRKNHISEQYNNHKRLYYKTGVCSCLWNDTPGGVVVSWETVLEKFCLLKFVIHPAALLYLKKWNTRWRWAARWRSPGSENFIIPYLQEFVNPFLKNFLKKFSSQNLTPFGEHLFALHSLYISVSLVDLLKC